MGRLWADGGQTTLDEPGKPPLTSANADTGGGTSVNRNVTTPEGAAAEGADTHAESHTEHRPTSNIAAIQPATPHTPEGLMKRALTASSFCTPLSAPASIIMPLPTTIATWPAHTVAIPGRSPPGA